MIFSKKWLRQNSKLFWGKNRLVTIGINSLFLIAVYLSLVIDDDVKDYDLYVGHIITSIGLILGAILVVSLFYLGKFHDYHKNYLKINSELHLKYASLKNQIKFTKNQNDILKTKLKIKFPNNTKTKLKTEILDMPLQSELFNYLEKFMDDKHFRDVIQGAPKMTFMNLIANSWVFVFVFFYAIITLSTPDLGTMYYLILCICVGMANFIHYWYETEHLVKEIKKIFENLEGIRININQNIGNYKMFNETISYENQMLDIKSRISK